MEQIHIALIMSHAVPSGTKLTRGALLNIRRRHLIVRLLVRVLLCRLESMGRSVVLRSTQSNGRTVSGHSDLPKSLRTVCALASKSMSCQALQTKNLEWGSCSKGLN
eukprot:1161508-Amphidinium_carterae.1